MRKLIKIQNWRSWTTLRKGAGIVVFDTDIFIWTQRGNEKAAHLMEQAGQRFFSIQTEEHNFSFGVRAGDALIAATAAENNLILASSNAKYFKVIKDLQLKTFKPIAFLL